MYFAYEDKLRAVKKDGFKLVEYAGENFRHTQLFNLKEDPYETEDLSGKEPDKVEAMRRELLKLRDEWDDEKHPTGKQFWDYYQR